MVNKSKKLSLQNAIDKSVVGREEEIQKNGTSILEKRKREYYLSNRAASEPHTTVGKKKVQEGSH